jgi:hypothetical protein
MLATAENRDVGHVIEIDKVESHMLSLPQAECPVVHHFGPGIYAREVTLPAGTMAIGHAQRFDHLNIMLTGAVAMVGDDGQVRVLQAPMIFVGKPGRKVGYVIETCTWQNIYPNPDEERSVDALEAKWLDKSQAWQDHSDVQQQANHDAHQVDRDDFAELIAQAGFTSEVVRAQSEDESDQIPMPDIFAPKITIRKSPIEGLGVFLSYPASEGEVLAPSRLGGMRTPTGRYTNHSANPNAKFVKNDIGDIYLVATRNISGCSGGDQGEEVTVDYRQALSLSGIHLIKGERA